jgi:hypothetical protein
MRDRAAGDGISFIMNRESGSRDFPFIACSYFQQSFTIPNPSTSGTMIKYEKKIIWRKLE